MKKTIIFIIIILLTISCTDRNEPQKETFVMKVKNESSESFTLKISNSSGDIFNQTILPNESKQICSVIEEGPISYFACGLANSELRFTNNKGYICGNNTSDTNTLCFANDRNLLGQIGYVNIGNNILEFKITQIDYTNAFVLP